MKLYIDTSNSQDIVLGLGKTMVKERTQESKSQKLLLILDQLLKKEGKKLGDITQIEVKTGPGSFTGLRVGISVANALGFALQVPVNGRVVRRDGPTVPTYE